MAWRSGGGLRPQRGPVGFAGRQPRRSRAAWPRPRCWWAARSAGWSSLAPWSVPPQPQPLGGAPLARALACSAWAASTLGAISQTSLTLCGVRTLLLLLLHCPLLLRALAAVGSAVRSALGSALEAAEQLGGSLLARAGSLVELVVGSGALESAAQLCSELLGVVGSHVEGAVGRLADRLAPTLYHRFRVWAMRSAGIPLGGMGGGVHSSTASRTLGGPLL